MSREVNRHLVYSYMLYYWLQLSEMDCRRIEREWAFTRKEICALGLRSIPSDIQKRVFPQELSKKFELLRIPGFYFDGHWKINLPFKSGLLQPYRNGSQFIQGYLIYGDVRDHSPKLLNSTGLIYGANAVPHNPHMEKAA